MDAVALTLDVPQRLVDTSDGAHGQRAAAIKATAIKHLPDILDVVGIAANQVFRQLGDGGGCGGGASFDNRFTPTDNAFVGGHFEKEPAWWHGK
jgi:hypothetical protein